MPTPRRSRVLDLLRAGKKALCFKSNLTCPRVAEIAGMHGFDMIFFGPGDFSYSIGDPCNFTNPEVSRVRKLVVETAHKYGKFAGTVAAPSMKECFAMGYDLVSCGADVTAIGERCKSISKQYLEMGR